jgi:hypothetical protein
MALAFFSQKGIEPHSLVEMKNISQMKRLVRSMLHSRREQAKEESRDVIAA